MIIMKQVVHEQRSTQSYLFGLLLRYILFAIVKTPTLTPTQHNTTVGFDMKMTVHTPPTQTFQALLDELES